MVVIKILFRIKQRSHITRSVVKLFYIPQEKRHSSVIVQVIVIGIINIITSLQSAEVIVVLTRSHKFYRIAYSTTTQRGEGPVLEGQWKNQQQLK